MQRKNKSSFRGRGQRRNRENNDWTKLGQNKRDADDHNNGERGSRSSNLPKPKFKVQFKKGGKPSRDFKVAMDRKNVRFSAAMCDDDVMMSASSSRAGRSDLRGSSQVGRRNNNQPKGKKQLTPANRQDKWFKVTLFGAQNLSQELILENICSYIQPSSLAPFVFKGAEGNNVVIYVKEYEVAEKISNYNKVLIMPDGSKLEIKVWHARPPIDINDALKERMKLAMERRYNPTANALDLTSFDADPAFVEGFWCPLAQGDVLNTVMEIVYEHIPTLRSLVLDSNDIRSVEKLKDLDTRLPGLKVLHLANNHLSDLHTLKHITNFPFEELRLEGNPLNRRYKSRPDDYIKDVRKRFPKLLRLDGAELPPTISFDVTEERRRLPTPQKLFVVEAAAHEIAIKFLQQYYSIFDAEKREMLLEAYHENALFSLSSTVVPGSSRFTEYLGESRNLRRIQAARRTKLLKDDRLKIVAFLSSDVPKTVHDLNSFTMDINVVTETMMLISITGMFKELNPENKKKEWLRYFDRTFTITPQGGGFCIVNEQWHISNATIEQEKSYNSKQIETTTVPTPGPAEPSIEDKQKMVLALCQETKMNLEWGQRCLEEVHWNYGVAQTAFQEAFASGKIPPDAFVK